MTERFLKPVELSSGPDLLRPGTTTGHLGNGQVAFIYTRHPDPQGKRFFTVPASIGHEHMITQENILHSLFGPELDNIRATITDTQEEYEKRGNEHIPTGRMKTSFDYRQIRLLSRDTNLYGRYGTVRGRFVLMLWQRNAGWEPMLDEVIKELHLSDDTILTVGTEEIGTIETFKNERRMTNEK